MKFFMFLAALIVVGLIVTGAIKLQKTDKSISIEIDRGKVREEARTVIKKGKEVFQDARSALRESREDPTPEQ
jgi:hypothetical protein